MHGVLHRDGTVTLESMGIVRNADTARLCEELALRPAYAHYGRIPPRICQCLDYFGVEYDRDAVLGLLLTYYLFIGLSDDALDSCAPTPRIGLDVLNLLRNPDGPDLQHGDGPALTQVTRELAASLCEQNRGKILDRLAVLHKAVLRERTAPSGGEYVVVRNQVGAITAEVGHLLIEPMLAKSPILLPRFFEDVGAVGCLVDSLIDLKADYRAGLLGFKPKNGDYLRLGLATAWQGWHIVYRHPRLVLSFSAAIVDTLQDELCARRKQRL